MHTTKARGGWLEGQGPAMEAPIGVKITKKAPQLSGGSAHATPTWKVGRGGYVM